LPLLVARRRGSPLPPFGAAVPPPGQVLVGVVVVAWVAVGVVCVVVGVVSVVVVVVGVGSSSCLLVTVELRKRLACRPRAPGAQVGDAWRRRVVSQAALSMPGGSARKSRSVLMIAASR